MPRYWLAMPIIAVLLGACQQPAPSRLNSPPQGFAERRHELGKPFQTMVDNATLQDMSVADCHFVAGTDQLSGLGVYRLKRLAEMLKTYGGTLRYDTRLEDQNLLKARLARLRDFLKDAGCDMSKVSVQPGMPGGEGLQATEAIEVLKASRKVCDQQQSSSSTSSSSSSGSGSSGGM